MFISPPTFISLLNTRNSGRKLGAVRAQLSSNDPCISSKARRGHAHPDAPPEGPGADGADAECPERHTLGWSRRTTSSERERQAVRGMEAPPRTAGKKAPAKNPRSYAGGHGRKRYGLQSAAVRQRERALGGRYSPTVILTSPP